MVNIEAVNNKKKNGAHISTTYSNIYLKYCIIVNISQNILENWFKWSWKHPELNK